MFERQPQFDRSPEPEITARDVENHFNALTGRDGWSARTDWLLIEAVCRGRGLAVAAQACGRLLSECRARWDDLYPEPRSLALQEMVVREARRRLELEEEP